MILAFSGALVAGAESQDTEGRLPGDVLAAMQRDLGLDAEQANRRAVQQEAADRLDDVLKARLGAAFGGAWFDGASGKLVVGVTDANRADAVTAAGAQARVVKHSENHLEAVKAELDALAGGKGDAKRKAAPGQADKAAVAGLTSWSVDPVANTVTVTALKGAKGLKTLAKYGDAVRVETTDAEPQTTAFLDGGDDLNYPSGGCSAGFNMRNTGTGVRYVLTAGHCGAAGSVVRGQGSVVIGSVEAAFFPSYDDALIRVTNTGAWTQGPWVDVNPPNGGVVVVSGHSDSPVGTAICKSGRTTKLTCGAITAKRQTVTYTGGLTVYDLTRHNACVEPGDSGGSNYRNSGTRTAEGVTSGAQLYSVGGRNRCGQVVGVANVSWYYPAALSVPYYQATYGATLW
ncbi:S1 family peptidase [Saccharothrix ecbatanensis]|uniref:S1 family peptidase n=1 Tax=Saccharothrix ecbatanensis TaxID=1105145 RepID=UPI0028ACE143|nr:S1 family peptidase [Saccharothrix ecbatanensis]